VRQTSDEYVVEVLSAALETAQDLLVQERARQARLEGLVEQFARPAER
jgi:hypothetical protein